jgi:hypothetical protein
MATRTRRKCFGLWTFLVLRYKLAQQIRLEQCFVWAKGFKVRRRNSREKYEKPLSLREAMEPKIITNISDDMKGFFNIFRNTRLVTYGSAAWFKIQDDQKVSVHLMNTVYKTCKNILNSFNHLP